MDEHAEVELTQPLQPPSGETPAQQAEPDVDHPPPSQSGSAAPRIWVATQRFWQNLPLSGQSTGIAGVLLVIIFFLPWFYTPDFTADAASNANTIPTVSYSGWQTAGGVKVFSILPSLSLFPHLWCVLLSALALIALALLLGSQHLGPRLAALLLTLLALGALLLEFFFLIQVNALEGAIQSRLNNAINQSLYGTAWGFWLAVIVTIAQVGVGCYLLLEEFAPDTTGR